MIKEETKTSLSDQKNPKEFIAELDKIPPRKQAPLKPRNKQSLSEYLGEYAKNFDTDLDALWQKCGHDNNGLLDKAGCKEFVNEVMKHTA